MWCVHSFRNSERFRIFLNFSYLNLRLTVGFPFSEMETLPELGNMFSGVSSGTPAPIRGVSHMNHGEKPEKFSGLNFKRWQQKMVFYLTTLGLVKYLTE